MITTGAISISQALMVNQTLLELRMYRNRQDVYIDYEYCHDDDEVKRMKSILYDRSRQEVRINYMFMILLLLSW